MFIHIVATDSNTPYYSDMRQMEKIIQHFKMFKVSVPRSIQFSILKSLISCLSVLASFQGNFNNGCHLLS